MAGGATPGLYNHESTDASENKVLSFQDWVRIRIEEIEQRITDLERKVSSLLIKE